MKKILLAIISVCLFSCADTKKTEEPEKEEIGEFVYVDKSGCLHSDKKCMYLMNFGENDEANNYQVKFIKTNNLTSSDYKTFCSFCVSDEGFKKLQTLTKPNDYEEVDSVSY